MSKMRNDNPPPAGWSPGGALLPIDRAWTAIIRTARDDGFVLTAFTDLPPYNRSRMKRGLAPFAVKMVNFRAASSDDQYKYGWH